MARRAVPRCPLPGRRLLTGTVATVLAFLPALPAAAASHRPPKPHRSHLVGSGLHATAVSCSEPEHRECLAVTAIGFLAGQRVLIRELRRPTWQQVLVADRRGMVRYRVVSQPHSDVLTFVGQGRTTKPTGRGTVAVSVPRIAVYRCPN